MKIIFAFFLKIKSNTVNKNDEKVSLLTILVGLFTYFYTKKTFF